MVSGVIKSQVFLPRWFPGWLLAWSRVLSRFDDQVYLVGFSVAFPFPLLFRVHGWVFLSFPFPSYDVSPARVSAYASAHLTCRFAMR
jgi:hypothetical protein